MASHHLLLCKTNNHTGKKSGHKVILTIQPTMMKFLICSVSHFLHLHQHHQSNTHGNTMRMLFPLELPLKKEKLWPESISPTPLPKKEAWIWLIHTTTTEESGKETCHTEINGVSSKSLEELILHLTPILHQLARDSIQKNELIHENSSFYLSFLLKIERITYLRISND